MKSPLPIIPQMIFIMVICGITSQAQPVPVTTVPDKSTNFITIVDLVYFTSADSLWRTDGTEAGTFFLKAGFNQSSRWNWESYAREFNGQFCFLNADSRELWRSDGTPSGTLLLKTSAENNIRILGVTEQFLFFSASDSQTGNEVYRTNGTPGGTVLIKDVFPGTGSGFRGGAAAAGNKLFFAGNNGADGTELWKSDGTSAGTVMIKDIYPGPGNGFGTNANVYAHNDLFYFGGNTAVAGMEPWVSDGTADGTFLLYDANPGAESPGRIEYTIAHNGVVYFLVSASQVGYYDEFPADLWRTSGTTASTAFVKTLGEQSYNHQYHSFRVFRDKIYFFDYADYFDDRLWVTDGTPAGTYSFFSFITMEGSVTFFGVTDDYLFFTGSAQDIPTPLYRSDGTREGTQEVTKFKSASYGGYPRDLTAIGDFVFYADHDGLVEDVSGTPYSDDDYYHLYRTDGTTPQSMGTIYGVNTIGTDNVTDFNGKVIFTAHKDTWGSTDNQKRLWLYDPSVPPEETDYFTLVHAGTDEDIRRLTDGALISNPYDVPINIRYNALGTPGSVVFELNGVTRRVENAAPYSLAGDIDGDYSAWEEAQPGTYKLTAIPYSEAGGKGTAGEALTITFTIKCEYGDDCLYTGAMLREVWMNVEGNRVSDIPVDTPPNSRVHVPAFEGPTNYGTNYGSRIRGFVIPPSSGQYTFWIASNDHSELWLSTDEYPANKIKIAYVTGATNPRQWDKFASQRSAPVTLESGRKYYIEALHKQGVGTDNIAVGWQMADGMLERPIPGKRLSPFIPSNSTSPTVRITNPVEEQTFTAPADILIEVDVSKDGDDGVITKVEFFQTSPAGGYQKIGEDLTAPYAFVAENVGPGDYTFTAAATDGDRNTTGSKGVNVTVTEGGACTASGTITREYWDGVSGNRVSEIPVHTSPTSTNELTIFEGPTNIDTNYGTRISGYICPPAAGEYTFWIASNDHSELWLSTDDDPANKVRIAYLTRATAPREWTRFGTQRSAPVQLEQGKRYYIEALHKQGIGTDHIAVGWQLPGGTLERPIPGNRLSPFEMEMNMMASSETQPPVTLNVYPNPVQSGNPELTISGFEGAGEMINARVEIRSMTGEVVFGETISCGGDCSDYLVKVKEQLVPGVYHLNLKARGVRYSERLLVK